MAQEGMLRNTGLRAARGTVETGGGAIRTAGNTQREAHMGRGSFINWYDDLGISTTEPQAQAIRKQEQEYQGQVSEQEGKISSARAGYTTAQQEVERSKGQLAGIHIPDLKQEVDKSWNTFKSGLVGVRVMGKDGIEATYYVPRDVSDKFIGQRGVYASYHDGGSNMNVMAKDYRNQELHNPLREVSRTVEIQYKNNATETIAQQLAKATSQLNTAKGQVAEAEGRVNAYGTEISNAEGMLSGVKQQHQQQWDDIHGKYRERASRMQEILGNLFVGGQENNG